MYSTLVFLLSEWRHTNVWKLMVYHLLYIILSMCSYFIKIITNVFILKGNYCNNDQDGCADNPCSPVQNCTDLLPSEAEKLGRGFNCSECPDGYTDNNGICIGLYD